MNTKTSFVRPISGDIIPFRVVGYVEWVSGADKRKVVLHTSLNTFPRINLASDESEGFYADYMQWLLCESGAAKPPQEEAVVPTPPSGLAKPVTYVVYNHSLECIGKGSTVAEAAERALEACWRCPVVLTGIIAHNPHNSTVTVHYDRQGAAGRRASANLLHIMEV